MIKDEQLPGWEREFDRLFKAPKTAFTFDSVKGVADNANTVVVERSVMKEFIREQMRQAAAVADLWDSHYVACLEFKTPGEAVKDKFGIVG